MYFMHQQPNPFAMGGGSRLGQAQGTVTQEVRDQILAAIRDTEGLIDQLNDFLAKYPTQADQAAILSSEVNQFVDLLNEINLLVVPPSNPAAGFGNFKYRFISTDPANWTGLNYAENVNWSNLDTDLRGAIALIARHGAVVTPPGGGGGGGPVIVTGGGKQAQGAVDVKALGYGAAGLVGVGIVGSILGLW